MHSTDDDLRIIFRNAHRHDPEDARQQAFCKADRLMSRQDALLRCLASSDIDDADRLMIGRELSTIAAELQEIAEMILAGLARRSRGRARRRR